MQVILKNRTAPNPTEIHGSSPLPLPNLSPLESRYGKRAFSRKAFKSFREEWEGTHGEEIRQPAARLVLMDTKCLGEPFNECFDLCESPLAIAALWTLGPKLENLASGLLEKNQEIEGILFNVAGSLTLVGMHEQVRQWIREHVAQPRNFNIIGEHYPGGPCLGMETLTTLLELADPEQSLGMTCRGGELLHPLKSGCALFLLGEGEEQTLSPVEPCNPCQGKKCLYFQMGGCHVAAAEGPEAI